MADTNDTSFENTVAPPVQPPITETDITPPPPTPPAYEQAAAQPQPVQQQQEQQAPQPSEEELQRIEANKPTHSIVDLEAQAYIDLDDAKDYKSGFKKLVETYSSAKYDDPEKAKEILATYSEHMRHRFKEPSLEVEDLVQVLPVKPEEVQGSTDLETVNSWEQANIKALQESSDPRVIAMSKRLIYDTQRTASNIRREQIAGSRGEGLVPWIKDKFFRVAEGAVSPFAKIIGAQETVDALRERTQPSRDDTLASTIASVGGAVAPMIAATAVTGGLGGAAVIAGQAAGEMRQAGKESMEATGDPNRASAAMAFTGAAQAVGMAPIARIGNKVVKSYAQKLFTESIKESAKKNAAKMSAEEVVAAGLDMVKTTYGQWAVDTLSAGIGGAAGAGLGNIGASIGMDMDIPVTQGMRNMAIAGAFIGGTTGAFHAAVRNASIDILREQLDTLKKPGVDQNKPADGQTEAATGKEGTKVKAADEATAEGDIVTTPLWKFDTKKKIVTPVEPDPTEGRNETVEERHSRELRTQRIMKDEQDKPPADEPEESYSNGPDEKVEVPNPIEYINDWSAGHQYWDAVHVTPRGGFEWFSKEELGANTGARSAKQAFFAAKEPLNDYAIDEHAERSLYYKDRELDFSKVDDAALLKFLRDNDTDKVTSPHGESGRDELTSIRNQLITYKRTLQHAEMGRTYQTLEDVKHLPKKIDALQSLLDKATKEFSITEKPASRQEKHARISEYINDLVENEGGERANDMYWDKYSLKELLQNIKELKDEINNSDESTDIKKAFNKERIKTLKFLEMVKQNVTEQFNLKPATPRKNWPSSYPIRIRAKNPLIIDDDPSILGIMHYVKKAKENKHDVIVFKRARDPLLTEIYAWFEPEQAISRISPKTGERKTTANKVVKADQVEGTSVRDTRTNVRAFVDNPYGESKADSGLAQTLKDNNVILTNTANNGRAHLGLMSYLKDLGSGLRVLMNVSQTAFGETEIYSQNVGGVKTGAKGVRTVVNILRSLGAKPERLRQTLAHELGHVIEEYIKATRSGKKVLNQKLEDITESMPQTVKQELDKLADFYELTADALNHNLNSNDTFYQAAALISSIWRKTGWNGKDFHSYRSQPTEIFADLISNWINHPEDFSNPSGPHADAYRLVGNELKKAMASTPKLHDLNTHIQRAINDPDYSFKLFSDMKKEGGAQQAKTVAEEHAKYEKYNSLGATAHRWLKSTTEVLFNKYREALIIARKMEGTARNIVFDIYNDLTRYGTVHNWIDFNYRKPLTHLVNQMIQDGIHPNQMDMYFFLKKIMEEKTVAMDNIEKDFPRYLAAAKILRDMMRADPRLQKSMIDADFNVDNITTPKQLSDAFAKVNLITDVAEVFKMEEVAKTVPHAENMTPEQQQQWENRFKAKYARLVAALARRKESIPIEELRAGIEDLPSEPTEPGYVDEATREALRDVLKPGAFNARRYLINMDGTDIYDAPRLLESLKKSAEAEAPGKFAKIEEHAQKFHDIMSKGYDILAKSGLFSPEMLLRFDLNKNNYVTNMIVDHFEGSESYEAVVRRAVGSFKVTGDELSSTFGQMSALVSRAYLQRSVNAALHLASLGGVKVEKIGHARPDFDIFAQKAKLSKSDTENSYLIGYEDGKASLYKVEGKSWENMFKDIRTMPVVGFFLDVAERLNKLLLTRQFKTVLSPAFVLMQKFYDRKLEAIMAGSWELSFGTHISKYLRDMDAATKAEIKHWQKTGELTGSLKTLVDLDGVMLSMIKRSIDGSMDDGMLVEHTIYEKFGHKIPGEDGLLEKASTGFEKVINKLYGDKLTAIAEFDELRTKLNGFRIGKHLGMGDAEAAIFAREKFGVPDPVGGGIAAPMINRAFLFGRAHLNGLRVLAGLLHDTPIKASKQILYRVAGPKLLMFAPFMGPAIAAVMGDEAGEVYKIGINMIPEYDKMAKNCMFLGFQDGQGNYHNFADVKKSDIQADWKAWYLRMPQSRELTSVTRVIWPLLKGAFELDFEKTVKGTSEGIGSVVSGNIQPAMQYMSNIVAIAQGKNPQDFFRNKPIFTKEMEMGGTLPQKAVAYGKYLAASHYPTAFPYNPFRTVDANNKAEKLLNTAPVVGPLMRSFSGVSNYGMIEKEADATNKIRQIDASIKLRTGDDTQQMFGLYSSAAGMISKIDNWKEKVGPDVVNTAHALTAWHSKIWIPYRNELRAALEKGDGERFDELVQALETSSSAMLKQAHRLASAVEQATIPDKSRQK